jgi:hypothetical protein
MEYRSLVVVAACATTGCAFWEMSDWNDRNQASSQVHPDGGAPADVVPLALDTFSHTEASGLGTSEIGGAWTLVGAASEYSVRDGVARMALGPGDGRSGTLQALSLADVDATMAFELPVAPNGAGAYLSLRTRVVASGATYSLDLRINDGNDVNLSIKNPPNETALAVRAGIFPTGYAPGTRIRVRFQVQGMNPTHLRGRAWLSGTPEPSAWIVEAEDAMAALQSPGALGFSGYVSGSATSGKLTIIADDFRVVAP